MSKSISTQVYHHLNQIPKGDWLDATEEMGLFHTIPFLSTLEQSKVENSQMFYWVAQKEGTTIATAVFSIFKISLDLFIGQNVVVKWINKHFPNFFKVTILFCGTPVSIGHKNLTLQEDQNAQYLFQLLEKDMRQIAKTHQIKHLIIKEISEKHRLTWGKVLLDIGWFEGFSIPDVKLKMRWASYSDYSNDMRSSFRRQVKNGFKKLNKAQKVQDPISFLQQQFKILTTDEVDVQDFYNKYLHVMQRAEVKLETLNLAFFEHLFNTFTNDIRIFSYQYANGNLAYFFTIHQDKTLYFLWTAREENKDDQDIYFNLYQAMIVYAIENQVDYFHLGQTAYYAKMRIGGIPEQRFIYYKCIRPIQHQILKTLRLAIFPPSKLQTMRVFKHNG